MLPALLCLLFKKLRKYDWKGITKRNPFFWIFIRSNQMIFTLVVILLLISIVLTAQNQSRNYKVIRKGSEIGWVSLEKQTDSNTTTISMGSEIKFSILLSFSSSGKEVSQFQDGRLQHSYFYRKMNGTVKADRNTHLDGNSYEVVNKSETTRLNILPVTYNTLCMYFQEPTGQSKVYSDNFQCFLDINKESDGSYKITSPDGTSNFFYYTSGVCYKVKIDNTFFSAVLMLK